jgi:serine/threonine protein phosphatase PrpC
VLDGHGSDGHKVSQYIRDNLCTYLLKQKKELYAIGKKNNTDRCSKDKEIYHGDSLIYYSSVGDNSEMMNTREKDLEFTKLKDQQTIFKQIQNYTKNVLIKRTFEGLNNNLK